jgi:hypothetical protein
MSLVQFKQLHFLFFIFFLQSNSLMIIETNSTTTPPPLLDNQYLKSVYFKDLINNKNSLIINNKQNTSILDISRHKNIKYIEVYNQTEIFRQTPIDTLIELTFPKSIYGSRIQLESKIELGELTKDKFQLEIINITWCGLNETFLADFSAKPSLFYSTLFHRILIEFFASLRLLKLSSNEFSRLDRNNFKLFAGSNTFPSQLEILMFDSNQLVSLKHDTFYDLHALKFIDLSNNKLKIIHPLTFANSFNLFLNNLANNDLRAIFYPINNNNSISNLKYLYLKNNDLKCDAGLSWLYDRKQQHNLITDDFKCKYYHENSSLNLTAEFNLIQTNDFLLNQSQTPNLIVDTKDLEITSTFSLFNLLSKRWFAWNVVKDELPVTTPYPYLSKSEQNDSAEITDSAEKHVFHTWYMSDLVLKCSSDPKSIIIWKTQFGYLSQNYIDDEIYKMLYKMNMLTKISNNISVTIGQRFGALSISQFYVNSKDELTVTNMRQAVTGPFVCIALNEAGIKTYEYDMYVRTGVSENFINSLIASLVLCIITLIIGIVSCCILERKAKLAFPETPPYYPTPMASTPPNFDFNEWMSNAASYLPNINIHDTLEQVSKKLRKGMEKASVTVKSLGLTSTAYIYSVYEHSTQRWSDIKSYVPTINVPLPTLRYTPVSQLANRMRTGVGNMFIPLGKFCGSSDLSHQPSINDLQSNMNASNSIGKILILDEMDLKAAAAVVAAAGNSSDQQKCRQIQHQYQGYYKFLNFLKEESKKNKSKQMIGDLTLNLDSKKTCQDDNRLRQIIILETPSSASSSSDSTSLNSTTPNELQSSTISNVSQPMTSAAANSSMQPSKQNYNLIVAYINPNNNALKISNIDEEDENYDDDEN